MGRGRQLLQKVSNRVNRYVSTRHGESFPFYYVVEYPKSGGTWLGRMVSDVLQVPFPQKSIFPVGCSSVLHSHWPYMARLKRVVYLYRDGRDIMVSAFFHRMRNIKLGDYPQHKQVKAHYDRVFGPGFDPENARGLLPKFIEDLYRTPWGTDWTWTRHIDMWYRPQERPDIAYVSYEQLRSDCAAHLARVIEHVSGKAPDPWRVQTAVDKFSIERQTGRKPGEENRSHFIRKAVAGDWKNHFTRSAAETFDRLGGAALVRLGYEKDNTWVNDCQEA
ncbi:MAG: sulfotransferase domain-containing protein [Phycisphaerales bacterium]|nr:sulfotransferase domain-containing protein [Phycisphaerales bacterium]